MNADLEQRVAELEHQVAARERAEPKAAQPAAAKPPQCKGECKGYFYTVLNDTDITIIEKPTGMDGDDAREAIKNALWRNFEADEGGKCADGCICQPLEVPTSGYGAPKYTKPWKETVTARIRWVNDTTDVVRHRTVKATVNVVKYHGEGICRPDTEAMEGFGGTFHHAD